VTKKIQKEKLKKKVKDWHVARC